MAITAALFGKFSLSLLNKEVNINTDVLKVMLTSGYTPDQDVHQYKSSVTSEITGTGYTAGGATIANVTVTYTAGTNTTKVAGDNVVWSSSTLSATYAIIYDSSPGSDATRPLIGFVNFGGTVSSTSGTFQITWNASGIFTLVTAVEA